MSTTFIVTLLGMAVIGALGFLGRRQPASDLSEWTVGGRRFGLITTWFLQAGEVFSTFTFLGLAGLASTGGAAAIYALAFIPMQHLVLYFVAPRIWAIGRKHGYVSQSDLLAGQYQSKALGIIVAIVGFVFLLPLLQLQINGLGLIVQLATGDHSSGMASMIIATVVLVAFVLWAGVHGVAKVSYFKDAMMIIMLIVAGIAISLHFTGGLGNIYAQLAAKLPDALTIHAGKFDAVWFLSNFAIGLIGAGFAAFPYAWPGILSARDVRVLRRNYISQPIYGVCVAIPITIGFIGMLVLDQHSKGNGALLNLAREAMPEWALGLLAVAGVATAMVPTGLLLIAMASMVIRNLAPDSSPRGEFWMRQALVVGTAVVALLLAVGRPDALANLALLSYNGLSQLAPVIIGALSLNGPWLRTRSVLAGFVVGGATVVYLTFGGIHLGTISIGLVALMINLTVLTLVEIALRMASRQQPA